MAVEMSVVGMQDETGAMVKGAAAAGLAALIVAALYFGRDVFVPIALAILLSFVLAPLVNRLEDWRLPRAVSVISVVLLAFLIIFAVGGLIASQVQQLAGDLPGYEANMRLKIASLRGTATTNNTLGHAADVLEDLGKELNKPKDAPPSSAVANPNRTASDAKPIPVEVRQPPPTALESVASLIAPLLHPLMTTGIVIIFVIFTLMQREDLRNRVIKLAGSHDLQKTTAALDDAAHRLSRLFLSQLALNSVFGVLVGGALWFVGIPSAPLWGVLAGILRFVPYIGTFISAVFPVILAVSVDPGWSLLAWTAAVFFVLEPLAGQIFEPMVYGRSTGLSPLAVVMSATFWTALWGPIGLVLATPLTICLVVLGRHVESLNFLDIMFGNRPALTPPEIFYQRMLAGDPDEAVEKAEEFLKERSLSEYYDEVALEGLKLAQIDLDRQTLDAHHLQRIRQSSEELINELSDQEDRRPLTAMPPSADADVQATGETAIATPTDELPSLVSVELSSAWRIETPVLCVAGRSSLDEMAAKMLAQLLSKHGLHATVARAEEFGDGSADIWQGRAMICLSFVDVQRPARMRYTIRRLRRGLPGVPILLGCWTKPADPEGLAEVTKADAIAFTLSEAVQGCLDRAQLV